METHLWTFGHTVFQQAPLRLLVEQWGICNNSTDELPIEVCVNQTFTVYLLIEKDEATTLPASLPVEYLSLWEMGLKHVSVTVQLRHDHNVVPFRATPSLLGGETRNSVGMFFQCISSDKRPAHLQGVSNLIVFGLDLQILVDPQYHNIPVIFELALELNLPQDLPFSRKLVVDNNERKIRMLVDNNRHSSPKCPPRCQSTIVSFIDPIQISHACHEVDTYSSILAITVRNHHRFVSLLVREVLHHINQSRIDVEKILDHFPQNVDESFEAVSLTENDAVSTAVTSSSSSASGSSPSVGHMFEFVPLVHEPMMILAPGDAKCIAYRIVVKQEVVQMLHNWSGFIPFGRFTSPFTINWCVHLLDNAFSCQTHDLLCRKEIQTHQCDLAWSISAHTLETRNTTLLADLLRFGYATTVSSYLSSYHPKSMINNALLKIEIEGPSCVCLNQEFRLKVLVSNSSKIAYSDVLLLTSSLQSSSSSIVR